MLRFIIKHDRQDNVSGLRSSDFETLDINVPELEHVLRMGGHGETGHDIRMLTGVEILREPRP
jgi:hypothetical protein